MKRQRSIIKTKWALPSAAATHSGPLSLRALLSTQPTVEVTSVGAVVLSSSRRAPFRLPLPEGEGCGEGAAADHSPSDAFLTVSNCVDANAQQEMARVREQRPRTRPLTSPRRGLTLVHLLGSVAVTSVVLTLAAGTLRSALALQRVTDAQQQVRRNLDRLADDFRRDVYAAKSYALTPAENATSLLLESPSGEQIRYTFAADAIRRTETENGRTGREEYRLPVVLDQAWQAEWTGGDRLVELHLQRRGTDHDQAAVVTQRRTISAGLGRDLRFRADLSGGGQ